MLYKRDASVHVLPLQEWGEFSDDGAYAFRDPLYVGDCPPSLPQAGEGLHAPRAIKWHQSQSLGRGFQTLEYSEYSWPELQVDVVLSRAEEAQDLARRGSFSRIEGLIHEADLVCYGLERSVRTLYRAEKEANYHPAPPTWLRRPGYRDILGDLRQVVPPHLFKPIDLYRDAQTRQPVGEVDMALDKMSDEVGLSHLLSSDWASDPLCKVADLQHRNMQQWYMVGRLGAALQVLGEGKDWRRVLAILPIEQHGMVQKLVHAGARQVGMVVLGGAGINATEAAIWQTGRATQAQLEEL